MRTAGRRIPKALAGVLWLARFRSRMPRILAMGAMGRQRNTRGFVQRRGTARPESSGTGVVADCNTELVLTAVETRRNAVWARAES